MTIRRFNDYSDKNIRDLECGEIITDNKTLKNRLEGRLLDKETPRRKYSHRIFRTFHLSWSPYYYYLQLHQTC